MHYLYRATRRRRRLAPPKRDDCSAARIRAVKITGLSIRRAQRDIRFPALRAPATLDIGFTWRRRAGWPVIARVGTSRWSKYHAAARAPGCAMRGRLLARARCHMSAAECRDRRAFDGCYARLLMRATARQIRHSWRSGAAAPTGRALYRISAFHTATTT